MKKTRVLIVSVLVLVMLLFVVGCGASSGGSGDDSQASLAGVWKYEDTENELGAIYDLKDDGTGTYTIIVGDQEVTYELKYEVADGHLLVTYVNNEIFTEDDVFDSEFRMEDENTMIVKDDTDMEMAFIRQ